MTERDQQQLQFARFLIGASLGHITEIFGYDIARAIAREMADSEEFWARLERSLHSDEGKAVVEDAFAKIGSI